MTGINNGKRIALAAAAGFTALLLCILFFFYMSYERPRTLQRALETISGEPLLFSSESGFYEEGFDLMLAAHPGIPSRQNIEIHYTLNGDEPTADSPLYDPETRIDLRAAVDQAVEKMRLQEKACAGAREEAIAQKEAELAAAAAAGTGTTSAAAVEEAAAQKEAGQAAAAATGTTSVPTIEQARADWELEKWLLASDAGVYPTRTDDGIQIIPVRACLIQGEDRSRVVTRTYAIGKNIRTRYAGKGIYVVSVTTDSANLFDYEKGIMVKGLHYEKDVAEGVREDRAGNFFQTGPEWVKDGHVTLFAPDGQVLLEEDTGLTISGYSSRTLATRSFRAEALPEHGSSDKYFHLTIFAEDDPEASPAETADTDRPEGSKESGGIESTPPDRTIDLFQKIKFRSHGVPGYHIRSVRNQYAKELTDECGFPGLVENRLAVMFLNGEFYSVCDITPSTTTDFLARLFGLNVPDAIEKLEGSDYDVYTRGKIIKLLEADLTDPANQKALEKAVDMDNYLFYMALEVLLNNADWPFNNVTMWRYLGEEDPSNPYSDGRFRFILDDMDQILSNGLHGDPARWSSELIDYLMKDKGHTFHHVMECTRYRDTFLTCVDDLLRTAFEPDHACAILDRLYGEMKEEYILDYGEAFWKEMEQTAQTTARNIREKETLYRANISKYMGLTDRYTVSIQAGSHASVTWNNMLVAPGRTWTSQYYRGTSFTVTVHPDDGYTITGWEVNGRPVQTDTPTLTISDDLLRDYPGTELTIRPMTE